MAKENSVSMPDSSPVETGPRNAGQDEAVARKDLPQRRSAERTRARILAAATKEFAEKGFAGARIDAIAERSQANKRMIYHYYGDKEGLYLAVLEAAYERVRAAERRLRLEQLEPEAAMRRLVEFTFDSFVKDRTFIQLLNTENLMRGAYIRRSARVRELHSPLFSVIEGLLVRGASAGVFRRDVDPVQLWLTIVAVSYFYFSNVHTLSVALGRDLLTREAMAERRDHVVGLIADYLRDGRAP